MAMRDLATLPFRSIARPRWYDPLGYAAALFGVATATGIMWLARSILSLGSIYLVYMVVVMAVAVGWGLGQSIVASAAAVLATNFFFIQPIFSFTVAAFQDALALAIFLALATLTSQLVARLRREASDARRGELIESTLYELSETINRQHNLGALLDAVAGSAARPCVARVCSAALLVWDGMLEVALLGVAVAGRERTGAVTDLDQVAEPGAGMVAKRLVAVVAVQRGHHVEAHGEPSAVW